MKRAVGAATAAAMIAVLLSLSPASGILPGGPAPDDAQTLFPITPCGVFDSRPTQGGAGKFTANEDRPATLAGTAACPDVPTEATGFLISIIAIGAEGLGSVKVWPTAEPEPGAGGVLAFSPNEFAPANTITVADGGDPDVTVKVLSNPAHIKIVLLGYYLPGVDNYEVFDRTIVVPADGTATDNGAALVAAVAAAAAGASPLDRWLVVLQAGTYALTAALDLPGHVHLQGAGHSTIVTAAATDTIAIDGTTSISAMSIVSTTADAIVVTSGPVTLSAVDVSADAGYPVQVAEGQELHVLDSELDGEFSIGVGNNATISLHDSTAQASDANIVPTSGTSGTANGVTVELSGSTIVADTSFGVDLNDDAVVDVRHSTIDAEGVGISVFEDGTITVFSSDVLGNTSGAISTFDTDDTDPVIIDIDQSYLWTSALKAIGADNAATGDHVITIRNSTVLGEVATVGTELCQGVAAKSGTTPTFNTTGCP